MTAVLLALLLASCSSPFGSNELDYESPRLPLEEAWARAASFEYQREDDTLDYWKSPAEFERDGGGDCEDFAAYMVYLLGPEARMAVLAVPGGFHAVVSWEGDLLEPQRMGCRWSGSGVLWELDWWYVMRRSTAAGRKSCTP